MTAPRPRIALTFGDPAGVGPELVARQLADPATTDAAEILLIGDEQELVDAMADAGVEFAWTREAGTGVPQLIDNDGERPEGGFVRREATREGGLWAMASLRRALELSKAGEVDAIVFAPLNKSSLHLAGMAENDEMSWFETVLADGTSATELNILPELVTARVTSHCSIAEVASLIHHDLVVERGELLKGVLQARGIEQPRIGVCALNPHAGESGKFGREEIDIIAPAIAELQRRGVDASGPFPSDTIFLKARDGQFDGVLTMYHDQGQIAVKLIGFDRGVTMAGGLSVAVCTPAHGTAFDVVGERVANTGAYEHAFATAVGVGAQARAARGDD
ncbi:4-hydroxythreonine-4-phosphate dehydrogenase PdxA [Agrococcus baldri]|uniref:4-hydroxythreonine-4-phosphate dehydrogenase 2 n=1 Tax=Agrococcus baldri TaxID=153730 RepID=A0AA87RHF4_9MICO|nr:4-hydroxythreonine-4-phosphate dehydrogenase PdxA [Agrococcus baldri]GEK79553.1 4-hydroxythreonine-4-phosphate dehydrogenase 2 [Agrococcus baldri]